MIITKEKVTKYVYHYIIETKKKSDRARTIRNQELNTDYVVEERENIRRNSNKVLVIPKLRYFQLQLLSGKIMTRCKRARWDKTIEKTEIADCCLPAV